MGYWLFFLLLTGSSFGFDSPQHQIRPSLGQLSEPAHGGAESLPSFHAITIEPCLPTGSPPTLSLPESGSPTHIPEPVHHDSNEPGAAELQTIVTERPKAEAQIRRPSSEGTSTRVVDNPRGPNWIECAVCLEEFDITALEDPKLVPDQAPLRRLVACRHTFHQECIDEWLQNPRKTCPHCRTPSTDDGIIRVNPTFAMDIEDRYLHPPAPRPSDSLCFRITIPILSAISWAAIIYGIVQAYHHFPTYA
ncbi:hypothetical protein Pst134EB_003870 [Puccinia striiformis f. sp. tritici]|nr:hypothetical protein Pst134EB_003870 [Puccinia striiformis f. sp. tritici]